MEKKIFALGDIHGNYKGLMQCLERSGFDYEKDTLIQLGDVCDGFSQTYEVVEELLKIKNLISICGNHDAIFRYWMERGTHMFDWSQGANHTAESYLKHANKDLEITPTWRSSGNRTFRVNLTLVDIPQTHIDFFKNQKDFYLDEKNRGFVHGGFNHPQGLGYETLDTYCWDRDLWDKYSLEVEEGDTNFQCYAHEEVFIGHSPVLRDKSTIPVTRGRVTNLDTGGGFREGKVSIMNVDTHEFWQSDIAIDLYPNEHPRK